MQSFFSLIITQFENFFIETIWGVKSKWLNASCIVKCSSYEVDSREGGIKKIYGILKLTNIFISPSTSNCLILLTLVLKSIDTVISGCSLFKINPYTFEDVNFSSSSKSLSSSSFSSKYSFDGLSKFVVCCWYYLFVACELFRNDGSFTLLFVFFFALFGFFRPSFSYGPWFFFSIDDVYVFPIISWFFVRGLY